MAAGSGPFGTIWLTVTRRVWIAGGWQFLPRPAAPVQNKLGAPAHRGGFGHGIHAASAGSAIIFRPKGSKA